MSTSVNPLRQLVVFLSLLLLLLVPWHASSAADCQVKNAVGEDVTATVVTTTTIDNTIVQQVLCQGDRACEDYTISNCEAVQCVGREACFHTTLTNIGKLVECQQVHSCHRAMVHFAEHNNNSDNNNNNQDPSLAIQQSMTCQGEGACNEAEIMGSRLLECFGPNACRNIQTRIDSVPSTHAEA